jgi:hypothetical protein
VQSNVNHVIQRLGLKEPVPHQLGAGVVLLRVPDLLRVPEIRSRGVAKTMCVS